MPRSLSVLFLAAVTGVAGVGAASAEDDPAGAPLAAPATATPVLSARRVPGLLAAPVADRRLASTLDGIVAAQPGTTCLTVSVGGREVYATRPALPLLPASVEKLLTAAAALQVLGPEFRFRTAVVAEAAPVGGVVQGDAWVIGSGDPVLATADYAARFRNQPQVVTSLEALADSLVAAGVTAVEGSLLGDPTRYDDDRYPDTWAQRLIDQDQSGPLSALTVNDGWVVFPPDPDVRPQTKEPAGDPAAHATEVLAGLLDARGVAVGGTGAGAAPPGAVELAAIESPPLSELVGEMLRESDNQTAELLAKELAVASGRPGTTVDGAAVIDETITSLGLPIAGAAIVDGSGLSETDLVSCSLIEAVLDLGGPEGTIGSSLAVAGQTGTLAERFQDPALAGRLHAKTGTLNQVTALAGFVDTTPGATLTFAFIANLDSGDVVDPDDLARQDELVAALLRYPEGPSLDELGPRP